MGVPTSEVGYTPAMPRREYHEVHQDMWWHWGKKKFLRSNVFLNNQSSKNIKTRFSLNVSEQHVWWVQSSLGAFEKMRKANFTFMSVRPSARLSICLSSMDQLGSHWTDSHEIWHWKIFLKYFEESKFLLTSDNNNRHSTVHILTSDNNKRHSTVHRDPRTFVTASR